MPELRHFRRVQAIGPSAVSVTASGLVVELGAERLELVAVRPDVVRVRMSRGGRFDERPTYAVVAEPGPVPVVTEIGADHATLRTAALEVRLGFDPFALVAVRPDGSAVMRTAVDSDSTSWAYATLNDAWISRRVLGPGEVYGLGERTGGSNRRGRRWVGWNTDVLDPHTTAEFTDPFPPEDPRSDRRSTSFDPYYVGVPLWYHRDPATGAVAGSFVDNAYRTAVDLTGASGYELELSAEGGQWCEYLIAGPGMAQVLEAYTWLTGRAALPPLWALGHQQCRWHDYTQAEVVALADAMRDHEVPCDAFWLDIDHMRGFRVFTWDAATFPDPTRLAADLAARGARLVTIVDPGVKADPGWHVYDDALARDLLCRTEGGDVFLGQVWPGDTAFPDFAREEVRAWWGALNAAHVATGVAGIWNDMNEPATGAVAPYRMRFDQGRAPHERYHNQYALLMAMGTTEGLRAARPDARPFVLSRAGFAGIQRYAATWTGDNFATWEFLAQSIPMSTGLGLSGQPFVGSDIGGFEGEPDAELFVRWMQYGMLTPFARNHAMAHQADRYPWSFGPDVLEVVREAIRLRYRLMPYLYSAFVQAAETGMPVQRPLVLADQTDGALAEVDDAYLLGPDLLVAPVLAPGVRERTVRLPAGAWVDWHTGTRYAGGATATLPTPLDRAPLLVRAGALVPTWPQAPASTAGYAPDVVELRLAVPGPGTTTVSTLQEDDGATTAALGGAFVRTFATVTRAGDRVRIDVAVTGDGFPEHRRTAFRLLVLGGRATAVTVDGTPAALTSDGDGWLLATGTRPFVAELELAYG